MTRVGELFRRETASSKWGGYKCEEVFKKTTTKNMKSCKSHTQQGRDGFVFTAGAKEVEVEGKQTDTYVVWRSWL